MFTVSNQEELEKAVIEHGKPNARAVFAGWTTESHARLRAGMIVYHANSGTGSPIMVCPKKALRKARRAGLSPIFNVA